DSGADRRPNYLLAALLLALPALALVFEAVFRDVRPDSPKIPREFLRFTPGEYVLTYLVVLVAISLTALALRGTGRRGVVLLGFVLVHLSVCVTILLSLDRWIAQYM